MNEASMEKFGFDPSQVGRYREHFPVEDNLDAFEMEHGIKPGDLCIRSRDGGDNPTDDDAMERPNFIASCEDSYDQTYRYYYFRPLAITP